LALDIYIVTGLALNNTELILRGAIPAALLAIAVESGFGFLEKWWVPKHLR
jgi:osmoprotectant transport system permease protein